MFENSKHPIMDILKKMFTKQPESQNALNDEFRKPPWSDEVEADDELFGDRKISAFQMFTNPLELQKYFDRQIQEVFKYMKEFEDNGEFPEKNFKEEYLKPGFESNLYDEFKKITPDTDLDGEIYADQLHSLMQRLSPDTKNILPRNDKPNLKKIKQKLSDEEKIMGIIHGSIIDEDDRDRIFNRKDILIPKMPSHFGGVFEGTYQGPKMFGQSVITQTLRKPDGTYETKRVVKDSDGNIKTTITRTKEGKSETITSYGNENDKNKNDRSSSSSTTMIHGNNDNILPSDRNIYLSKKGYALPKNLW